MYFAWDRLPERLDLVLERCSGQVWRVTLKYLVISVFLVATIAIQNTLVVFIWDLLFTALK
jgi:hypothetical protein